MIIVMGVLVFIKERAFGHRGGFGHAEVESRPASAFTGEHLLGAFLVLLEFKVLINGKGMSHPLYIQIVSTNQRESPVLLLQFLDEGAYHLQGPLLAAVLIAIGDDGHKDVVAILEHFTPEQIEASIKRSTQLMKEAAKSLDFLQAAQYRDEIIRLQDLLEQRKKEATTLSTK